MRTYVAHAFPLALVFYMTLGVLIAVWYFGNERESDDTNFDHFFMTFIVILFWPWFVKSMYDDNGPWRG